MCRVAVSRLDSRDVAGPSCVQTHTQRSLDFGDDPKSIDILGMVSGEGERVPLGKNVKVGT